MDNLLSRLRDYDPRNDDAEALCNEAAAEIERLEAALAKIDGLSDSEMADGDGAREIAQDALRLASSAEESGNG